LVSGSRAEEALNIARKLVKPLWLPGKQANRRQIRRCLKLLRLPKNSAKKEKYN
jgi:hypothetical protein